MAPVSNLTGRDLSQPVTEIALLVTRSQADRLEDMARIQGITLGQFLRRIISSHAEEHCLAK